MVKLTGPGLAKQASGSVAGELTFSTWKGRAYLKKKSTPIQPQSEAQVGMRTMMTFLSSQWQNLTAGENLTWADLAAEQDISPINAYLQYNLANWRNNLWPSKEHPAARLLTAIDFDDFYIGAVGRGLWLYLHTIANADCWGWTVHIGTVPSPGSHWDNLAFVRRRVDANYDYSEHMPYPPGTYYATAAVFSRDGAAPFALNRGPFTVTN